MSIGSVKFRMPDEVKRSIGLEICKARERLGMTQPELAEAVGYENPKQIYMIESGRSTPSVIMLARLCEVLRVSMDRVALSAKNRSTYQKI